MPWPQLQKAFRNADLLSMTISVDVPNGRAFYTLRFRNTSFVSVSNYSFYGNQVVVRSMYLTPRNIHANTPPDLVRRYANRKVIERAAARPHGYDAIAKMCRVGHAEVEPIAVLYLAENISMPLSASTKVIDVFRAVTEPFIKGYAKALEKYGNSVVTIFDWAKEVLMQTVYRYITVDVSGGASTLSLVASSGGARPVTLVAYASPVMARAQVDRFTIYVGRDQGMIMSIAMAIAFIAQLLLFTPRPPELLITSREIESAYTVEAMRISPL
jgi:hypothetical protein